jgi:MoxR-like ATPase
MPSRPITGDITPLHDPEQLPLAGEDLTGNTTVTAVPHREASARADLDAVAELADAHAQILAEIEKRIIGQRKVVEQLLVALFARGHTLFVGVPGLAKTLLISTLAETLNLSFQRIQFTPDLMPADITGTEVLEEDHATRRRAFRFIKGPVFANLVLADEINRTPPKTQAALLQSMQEYKVTAGGNTHDLPLPFLVFATQNPIEQEGTYPLPEAQLDRFMFQVDVEYPSEAEEEEIVRQQTSDHRPELVKVLSPQRILQLQELVRRVPAADHVVKYAVALARSTRPTSPNAPPFIREAVSWGAGPRASQFLILAAKARAILDGRFAVAIDDVAALARPTLQHRLILNYRAEAEGLRAGDLIDRLLSVVTP